MALMRSILIGWLALACLSGCRKEQWDDCLTGTGDIVMDERFITGFDAIDLGDRFDLEIVPDTVDRVILETGQRLLEQMRTEVVDGTLVIRDNNTCNWVRRFDVTMVAHVHCRDLRELVCRGTGEVTCTGPLTVGAFNLQVYNANSTISLDLATGSCTIGNNVGASDISAHGHVQELRIYNGGHGRIDTRELDAQDAWLNNSSDQDIRVRAIGAIGAEITSSGNAYYSGGAVVAWTNISGTGRLIEVD